MLGAVAQLAPPLAHIEDWSSIFYVMPPVIVFAGIAYSILFDRRR